MRTPPPLGGGVPWCVRQTAGGAGGGSVGPPPEAVGVGVGPPPGLAGGGGMRDSSMAPRGAASGGAPRERVTYKTTCANCGQETTVPFVPRGTKPVYCSNCFDQMRGGSSNSGRGARY